MAGSYSSAMRGGSVAIADVAAGKQDLAVHEQGRRGPGSDLLVAYPVAVNVPVEGS